MAVDTYKHGKNQKNLAFSACIWSLPTKASTTDRGYTLSPTNRLLLVDQEKALLILLLTERHGEPAKIGFILSVYQIIINGSFKALKKWNIRLPSIMARLNDETGFIVGKGKRRQWLQHIQKGEKHMEEWYNHIKDEDWLTAPASSGFITDEIVFE
ncbi:hypothetical protein TSTA_123960 [Talaromyces stipitatus ATCC 10500]|uniref:Uncharacterized protein n=1 Tax=Talaromyces stipitatus (strain ATCC 10500 / CBS 375.48 / QM 6759 / NRRL 1006) TaxID=441959 RepID=B8MAW7_TALSN|nr:uncharacterized protein TSTA_123960 [Talaromyces stipitatus ATCC 10500]EED18668.1 hypothetical protein TSTA_123960 [Talaromyces stipitatus ATCC 10500]